MVEFVELYKCTLFVGEIPFDMFRENDLPFHRVLVGFHRFIAALQAALDDGEHFIKEHSDENFKEVHPINVDVGGLNRFVGHIAK